MEYPPSEKEGGKVYLTKSIPIRNKPEPPRKKNMSENVELIELSKAITAAEKKGRGVQRQTLWIQCLRRPPVGRRLTREMARDA
jgi:hypothetical protein